MTITPFKKSKVLRRVRCSPRRGTRRIPQDDWKSAENFSFPESPIFSKRTASKRAVVSSDDKGLLYKNRRPSVLLKRLDLPPALIRSSPANSRRTRRQSMIHLNLEDTVRSNISNNNIPQSIEEESSLKIPESKMPSIKTAPARKSASKPVIAKKDVSKTKLPEKKNGMLLAAQKLKCSSEKPTLTSQHKSLGVSETANSTLPKNKTKRRIEIEAICEVEPSAKKGKLGPSSNPKFGAIQKSCPKQTLQKPKAASHSLGQKKAANPVPSSQTVKAKSPSPAYFEKSSFTLSSSSRPQTRAITKKVVPKNPRENISTSPLVAKTKQEKKTLAPANSSSDTQIEPAKKSESTPAPEGTKTKQKRNKTASKVLKAVRLVPVGSSKDSQIEPAKKKESTPEPEVTTTKGEKTPPNGEKTPPNASPEALKAVRLVPVGSSKDSQIEPAKKKESTPDPEVTTTKEGEKTPPSSEVLKALRLVPVDSSKDSQIEPAKEEESLPDPEVVQAAVVKPTPDPQRRTKPAARSSKRAGVTGISPQNSFVEFKKTVAPDGDDVLDHNVDIGSSPVLLSARMQLQIIRNTPMRYKHVQPFTPRPDPPPSHMLKQTLKKRVDHELEKDTQVEVDALMNGECSIPDTGNESCCDVSVLTQDAPNSAPNEGCSAVPVFTPDTPTSTTNLPTTPKSSRHQALTHSRPVESSCNLDNVPCQQDSPPATPRSSTPIEEETYLDCLTVDPVVKGATKESGTGASAESFDTSELDDDNDNNDDDDDDSDDNDDNDDNDDSDDSDDNDSSAEMEVGEDTTPPESKRSYCVLM